MKKKLLAMLLGLAMVTGTAAGCAGPVLDGEIKNQTEVKGSEAKASSAGDVVLKWAVFETDNYTAEVWEHIINSFEKDNPGIKIEKVLMTGDSRPQFLKTMLAAGNFPDIVIDPVEMAKIENVFAEVPEELLQKFEDGTVPTFDEKKTLIPASKSYRAQTFYNKAQFKEAGIEKMPETWEEFIATSDKLKAKGFTPLITAGSGSDQWATAAMYFVAVPNSEIINKYPNFNEDLLSGKVKWTDSVVADSLQKFQDLNQQGYFHKGSMSFSYTQACSEFTSGNASMMIDGVWKCVDIDNSSEYSAEDFGSFAIPTPTNLKTYCASNQYWAVSKECKNKEAAFKFCEYVLGGNPEIYKYLLQADGNFSVSKELVSYETGASLTGFVKNFEGYTLIPEITKTVGDVALPSGFEDFILKSMQNVFTGADIQAELESWDTEFNRLMEESK